MRTDPQDAQEPVLTEHRCNCGPRECLHPSNLRRGFRCAVETADRTALRASMQQDEATLNKTLRGLTPPSVEAWELIFGPLDADERAEMSKMLASFAAMVITHHKHHWMPLPAPPIQKEEEQAPRMDTLGAGTDSRTASSREPK